MRKIIRLCVGVMLIFISLGFFFYPDFRNWKIEYSNAIVHAFQKFKAPFSGKIVHIFPEQSAVI